MPHNTPPQAGPMGAGDQGPPALTLWWLVEGLPRLYLGQLCLAEGDLREAAQHLAVAQATVTPSDMHDVVLVECLLAHLDLVVGRPAAASARLAPFATQPGPREGWEWQVMPLLVLLAWAHLDLDEVDQAAVVAARAVTCARAAQFRRAVVEALWMQARVAMRQRRWAQACQALEEGVELARRIRYPYGEARLLHIMGEMDLQKGETATARARLEVAHALFHHLGARTDAERVARAIENLSPGA